MDLWRESTFGLPPSDSPLMYLRKLSAALISVRCISVPFALKIDHKISCRSLLTGNVAELAPLTKFG